MSENTKIEWATHTFNPWVGCTKISPACDHCYAEGWAKRSGQVVWGGERKRTSIANWRLPIKWDKHAALMQGGWAHGVALHGGDEAACIAAGYIKPVRPKVFCASLADVFDNAVDPQWRTDLFYLILTTPNLDWLLLTKRIGNALTMMYDAINTADEFTDWEVPLENLWIGVTICNQTEADRDIPKLLAVPAHKRFLSIEPLLGPVNLIPHLWGRVSPCADCSKDDYCECGWFPRSLVQNESALDWVIVGGESGPNARAMLPHWAASLRDQCQAADVPFLFKQWGEWAPEGSNAMRRVGKKAAGRLLDGREWNGAPA